MATRYDIAETPTSFENYRSTVLLTMRSEDFRIMTDEWMAEAEISYNEDVIKGFTP